MGRIVVLATAHRINFNVSHCCELILYDVESHQLQKPVFGYLLAVFTSCSLYKYLNLVLGLWGLCLVTLTCCQYKYTWRLAGERLHSSLVYLFNTISICVSPTVTVFFSVFCFRDTSISTVSGMNWKGY